MPEILLKNLCLGGMSRGDFLESNNAVAELVGFDIHSNPGLLKMSNALVGVGSNFNNEPVMGIITSLGDPIFFSMTTGKVWRKDLNSGTVTLVTTVSPTSGGAGCTGREEFDGKLWWATETKIFYITVANAHTNDNWGANHYELNAGLHADNAGGYTKNHPFFVINNVLYIGDGKFLRAIRESAYGVVSDDELNGNIKDPFRINCLGVGRKNMLVGLTGAVGTKLKYTNFLEWNTWSESFNVSDDIPADAINAIIPIDNGNLISAGKKGALYTYDGEYLDLFQQIRGDYEDELDLEKTATVWPYATFNFRGMPLFGVSNENAEIETAKAGIYSYARSGRKYPYVMSIPYLLQDTDDSWLEKDLRITSIFGNYEYLYICGYRPSNHHTLARTAYFSRATKAYIKTKVYDISSGQNVAIGKIFLGYKNLPETASITFEVSKNFGDFVTIASEKDAINKVVFGKINIGKCNYLQARVTVTIDAELPTDAPEITFLKISI